MGIFKHKLTRRATGGYVGGVFAGLAAATNSRAAAWRLVFVLICLFGSYGGDYSPRVIVIALYLCLWVGLPLAKEDAGKQPALFRWWAVGLPIGKLLWSLFVAKKKAHRGDGFAGFDPFGAATQTKKKPAKRGRKVISADEKDIKD